MMKEMWMRFMMVVIRKGYETAAADAAPGAEAVAGWSTTRACRKQAYCWGSMGS